MKLSRIVAYCIILASLSYSYDENSMPDLAVPTQIETKSLEATVMHRFYRNPSGDFPDNFINLANVKLGLRYVVLPKFEVGTSYQFFKKEYTFHSAYSLFFPNLYLRTQARIQFFGAQHDFDTKWDFNGLYQVDLQSEPLFGKLLPVVDIAYNGLSRKAGLGTGIDVVILENLDILGEYYPVLGTRDISLNGGPKVDCFQVGVKLTTAGHHFMFTISNNYDIGMRRLMAGTDNNILYFGFNIQRLFSF